MLETSPTRRAAYAICLLAVVEGCTSTSAVPVSALHPGVVRDQDGDELRIDPNSEVRFERSDGAWTEWYGASELLVNDDGVIFPSQEGIRWADVKSAEVKNLSGGKTLVGVVAVSALAVGLVALTLVARRAPDLKLPGDAAVHVVARLPNVHVSGSGSTSGPDEEPSSPPPVFAPPVANDAHHWFDADARRRAAVRFGLAADYGSSLMHKNEWTASGVAILRFSDLFEIGGGVRFLRDERVYLARAGLHAELDARQLFALPFSIDIARGPAIDFHARLNFGLRIQLIESLYVGLHPLNPTYTRARDGEPAIRHWTFPTTVETSFTF